MYNALPNKKIIKGCFVQRKPKIKLLMKNSANRNSSEIKIKLKTEDNQKNEPCSLPARMFTITTQFVCIDEINPSDWI